MNDANGEVGGQGEQPPLVPSPPPSGPPPASLPPQLAPVAPGLTDPSLAASVSPRRDWPGIALFLLLAYIALPATLGALRSESDASALPASVSAILFLCGVELCLFTIVFGLAWFLGRLSPAQVYLGWRGGFWVLPRSLGWSVALRVLVGIALMTAISLGALARGVPLESLEGLRPKVEAMVEIEALRNPAYLILMLTLVSFVFAGLREELWRAGVIALLGRTWPHLFGGRRGAWWALLPTALIFGLGHTAQGWMGVGATTLIGLGLGAILLFHRSLWDAVLAHGFFDATTFALLPLLADHFPNLAR